MLIPELPDRQAIKFPKISQKAKSIPQGRREGPSLDMLSAKSWLYYTPNSLIGYKTDMKRDIASLTKIMTAICSIELCQKYKITPKTTYFKVTSWAAQTQGTTSNLQQNAWISVQDLLYGMMLPSGNDAAVVLAQNFGAVLYFDRTGNQSLIEEIRSIDLTQDYQSVKIYMNEFISFMNNKCKLWKMFKTRFANPHGLDNLNNYSCCQDILIMCQQATKNQTFKKIVSTATYKGAFKFFKEGKVICRAIHWVNTNKLLEKRDIIGIKTGITNRAGGCLVTLFQIDRLTTGIIVVLGCVSAQSRFKDTLRILNWISDDSSFT